MRSHPIYNTHSGPLSKIWGCFACELIFVLLIKGWRMSDIIQDTHCRLGHHFSDHLPLKNG